MVDGRSGSPRTATASVGIAERKCADESSRPRSLRPPGGAPCRRGRAARPDGGRGPRQRPRLDRHARRRHGRAQRRVSLHRLFTGIRRPRRTRSGTEFAGRVEEVGPTVTEFRVGDEVFGVQAGANAEYVTVRQGGVIARKPTGLTYEEAAALPDGSLLALSCLRPAYPLRGKRVLVYGAAGSIGTAAVQLLAHHFEAEVTAVCDTKDVEVVRSLGARDGPRSVPRGLHGQRRDLRRDLRRGRQALVPSLPAARSSPAGSTSSTDLGFMYHVPLLALVTRVLGSKRGTLGLGRYRQEDLAPRQGAGGDGEVPARDRPEVHARRGRGGDTLRRERPEDGQRRALPGPAGPGRRPDLAATHKAEEPASARLQP